MTTDRIASNGQENQPFKLSQTSPSYQKPSHKAAKVIRTAQSEADSKTARERVMAEMTKENENTVAGKIPTSQSSKPDLNAGQGRINPKPTYNLARIWGRSKPSASKSITVSNNSAPPPTARRARKRSPRVGGSAKVNSSQPSLVS